ncbi:MAG: glycosyltransferase [Candidatus Heimdallarchaeota archaeon]|nr:glycosyltransferase [Candidatus Heimdallarchaeota archaeon]
MKIAVISNLFYPILKGGGEKRYWEIAKRLARKHDVHVFTLRWGNLHEEEIVERVKIHRIAPFTEELYDKKTGKRRIKPAIVFSLELLKKFDPRGFDIIECNVFPFLHCPFIKFKAMTHKIPFVLTIHEVWGGYWKQYLEGSLKGGVGIWIEKRIANSADHIIAVSDIVKEQIIDELTVPKAKVSVVSNGVDLELTKQAIKGIRTDPNKIVYAGRLVEHKRVEVLIKAMKFVLQSNSKAHLEIVGGGPELNQLKQLAKTLQLEKKITIHDYLESYADVLRIMASGSVFVLPSIREGQGIVLLEAMATETPTIGVRFPRSGVLNVIKDKQTGLLVEANSAKAIAEGILTYWNNPQLKEEIITKASNFARQFDWNNITAEIERIYHQVLSKR